MEPIQILYSMFVICKVFYGIDTCVEVKTEMTNKPSIVNEFVARDCTDIFLHDMIEELLINDPKVYVRDARCAWEYPG